MSFPFCLQVPQANVNRAVKEDAQCILLTIVLSSDFEMEGMETDKDQIPFLIRYIPRLSIAQIVRRLKQESTRQSWQLPSGHSISNMGISSCFGRMATLSVQ
jgi:REP element-mobilizing transposase RayT